jgi:putative DNA primase/helicase
VDDGLDFSPLSDAEREAGQEQAREATLETDRPTPPPEDAEAAEKAAARLFGGPPGKMWPYRNRKGAIHFWVCRWNVVRDGKPDKVILPLSWFLGGGWRFAHWPDPRPLYKLDEIQSNPDSPVVVCEGEKAADAAARIFPNSNVTTSCGGSGAARLSDWTPLADRSVLIWRDNDEPSATYEREVATVLTETGCDVAIVDVGPLVQIDGGARGPDFDPVGWDAANAINEWKDRDSLRKAVVGLAKPFHLAPAYVSFGP